MELTPPRAEAAPATRAKPRAAPTLALAPLQSPTLGPISIAGPPAVADIDLSSKINAPDSTAASVARISDIIKQVVDKPASEEGRVGPYSKEEVERVVAPFPRNPKPVYPGRLEREGVETSFIAQFVVDSTGLVDRESILFPTNVHALFIESVREALRRARFYPAEVGGRRVRQLVEQQFSFIIVDSRGARR
jgi:protein TonB